MKKEKGREGTHSSGFLTIGILAFIIVSIIVCAAVNHSGDSDNTGAVTG